MRKWTLVLLVAALGLWVAACGEDDPVKPAEFAVTIAVTTPEGTPVEGLRVYLVNDHPFFQDGGKGAKAVVSIPFRTELNVHARFTIEDIEGRTIRFLWEEDLARGSHRVIWDGVNDAGDHMPSGRYTVHLVCTNIDTGFWVFEDRADMLLSMLDAEQAPSGFTDAGGKLVLTDKTLFPHLYDRPAMMATDENGESLGLIKLTSVMRICVGDTASGRGMWVKRVVNESETVKLTWDPPPVAQAPEAGNEPLFPGVAQNDTTNPEYFKLGLVFPNPFN